MRRSFKNWIILSLFFALLLMIGLEIASAQAYQTFVGEVVSIHRRFMGRVISVKGDNEEVFLFAVGRNTVYVPPRLPGIGERVKVEYGLKRGHNVAYKIEVVTSPKGK